MQVAGRAGRAELPGEVLIQTQFPDHPLYAALVRHDYPAFANEQLKEREQAGFPPYAYQAMLRAEAPQIADSLAYLSLDGLEAATGHAEDRYCRACLTGVYPTIVPLAADKERFEGTQLPVVQA